MAEQTTQEYENELIESITKLSDGLPDKQKTTAKIMAEVLHDMNPQKSPLEWEKHILENNNNPKGFFQDNGEGLNEYHSFLSRKDKDKYERELKRRKIKEKRKR